MRSSCLDAFGARVNLNGDPVCEHCGDPRTNFEMGHWLCEPCAEDRLNELLWLAYLDELNSTFEEPA